MCYVKEVPDGHKILKDNVSRLYPSDDCEMQGPGVCDQPLEDVIQEALQRHFEVQFQGICEKNVRRDPNGGKNLVRIHVL